MSSEIIINVTLDEVRVGLLERGQLVEFYVERKKDASLVGNIYKGKVVKILPGMQSAFIDIGLEKAAFLYVDDIKTDVEDFTEFLENGDDPIELTTRRGRPDRPDITINELIQEGQDVLLQVSKDPIGTKGARGTSYITLPGRYLVLMPTIDHIGISRRIVKAEERQRLRNIVDEIKPKGYGLIVRTASESEGTEELRKDMEFLMLIWENILKKKENVASPSMLYSDLDLIYRSVRDLLNNEVERLVIDSREEFEHIQDFVKHFFPKLYNKIEFYDRRETIFDFFGIELDVYKGLDRRVWLKSGGYIVIDQTEAMTVIDVNTGKYVGKEDLEDTILKANLEAVKEIAYQIRLRNLGGIIIIDFIDMEIAENREKLYTTFVETMKKDRAKNTIFNVSEIGLIQMTRKRIRESLGRTLCESCPMCEGKGFVKSTKTVSYEIFRKLKRMPLHKGAKVTITAHPIVADYLSDEQRHGLEEFEVTFDVVLIIKADSKLQRENFDIAIA
ncbi:ribonuclease, Rne/Rng family [Candidatus Magnetobacterium bavaricum]|uniref:Ribonuclease G n=1 Tax=Candidatus Magnetobacterium bavaricum TaxID=29290 RepID=A0A0F3H030_9BACT|nr:ribonuclease, Rne/Rng family [Candidatus Magnetobacterium bavaricum]